MTTPLPAALHARLRRVRRSGDFAAFGARSLPVFPLRVGPLGLLGLPLTAELAGRLYAAGSPAPFGRGEQTLYDRGVRSCHQLPAEVVDLGDWRWGAALEGVLAEVGPALGVEGEVDAHLYKMLVYGPGDFFLEHRDTEKERGMFGTLVVSLPCEHEGGELVVSHGGRTLTGQLGGEDLGVARWAAFYADCVHELRPVTAGWRVVLVYNLVRAGRRPRPPENGPEVAALSELLRGAEGAPWPLCVVPLQHHYSGVELALDRLKGVDAAWGHVGVAAAKAAGVSVGLAVLEVLETWTDSELGWGFEDEEWEELGDEEGAGDEEEERARAGEAGEAAGDEDDEGDDTDDGYDDDGEELQDRSFALSGLRAVDGLAWSMPRLGLSLAELAAEPSLRREKPDATRLVEATGNEGASREKLYRRAALVFVHPERTGEAVARSGFDALKRHVQALTAAGESRAARVLDRVFRARGWTGLRLRPGAEAELFDLVSLLAAHGLDHHIAEVVTGPLGEGAPWREASALPRWLAKVPPAQHAALLERALGACRPGELAGLLAAADGAGVGARIVEPVLARLCEAVRGARGEAFAVQPRPLAMVLRFLGRRADEAQQQRALAWLLDHLQDRPVDKVLLPAVEELVHAGELDPAWEPLRAVALGTLYTRTALRPRPPEDQVRDASRVRCTCASCRELIAFLEHPTRRELSIAAHGTVRKHVEEQVAFARLDLDRRTLVTRPTHTLVLTKNSASYRALRDAWREDVARIVALGGDEPSAG